MPKVTFVCPDSRQVVVEGDDGAVIMQLAVENDVEGIDGDCGGTCNCATCHVHVAPEWFDRVGPAGEMELEMLEFDGDVTPHSRLSCQLRLTSELDGIVLAVVGR
jgi:ferredoxin, 2Fe-2S